MTSKLFIDTERKGYSPEQINRTMTVRELIEYLQQFDEETQVYLRNDNGYTYGGIRESSFEEEESEDDNDEG